MDGEHRRPLSEPRVLDAADVPVDRLAAAAKVCHCCLEIAGESAIDERDRSGEKDDGESESKFHGV
jgi:hypothetical protein